MRKALLLVVVLLVISTATILWLKRPTSSTAGSPEVEQVPESTTPAPRTSPRSDEDKRARAAQLRAEASRSLKFDQSKATLLNDPMDRSQLSEMALVLDQAEVGDIAAMEAILSLLTSFRTTANQGSFPAGINVEITNALLGKNRRKVGYLPGDCPRINENGELVDAHGTPYWFHSISAGAMTITSAGPDRLLHTGDDLTLPQD